MNNIRRIKILGVPVDCVDMNASLNSVDSMIASDHVNTIIAVNPEKIIKAQDDVALLNLLNNSSLLIPDGIGAVVAARLLYKEKIQRVPGAELMPKICEMSAGKRYKIYLLGASPDVNVKAVEVLKERYPGINIVGNHHGYFTDDQVGNIIEDINMSGAQILFIALGSPSQELWMEKYIKHLNIKVCQGVGGTFDVLAGKVTRAPFIFRKLNLEWFYRLISQPKRLIRQTALPKYAYYIFREYLTGIKN